MLDCREKEIHKGDSVVYCPEHGIVPRLAKVIGFTNQWVSLENETNRKFKKRSGNLMVVTV